LRGKAEPAASSTASFIPTNRDSAAASSFEDSLQRGSRQSRQKYDAAIRMDEEFDAITRLETQMFANRFWNGRLALHRNR
jgi:hypothetical protein